MKWYPEVFDVGGFLLTAWPSSSIQANSVSESALVVSEAEDIVLRKWFEVGKSGSFIATVKAFGMKQPGSRVELFVQFYGSNGKRLGRTNLESLPPGILEGVPMVAGGHVPIGSERGQVGIVIRHQRNGEIRLSDFSLFWHPND